MKAYVITMSDNEKSLAGVETLKQSIESTSTDLELEVIEAVQPATMGNANFNLFGRTVPWTWSTSPESDAIDLHTGLYKRHYKAVDQKRVESCALSHFNAWMKCCTEAGLMHMVRHLDILLHELLSEQIFQPFARSSSAPQAYVDPRVNGDGDTVNSF